MNKKPTAKRSAATKKLIENEERYRALYENAPLPYQSLNEDGSFKDVNPAWLKTLGYSREEVIGKYFRNFLHPDWQSHFDKNFPAFKKRGYVNDVQFKIRHKNGKYRDISFEGCIGYNPDGSFRQTYCVFQDITDRKRFEQELVVAKEQAEQNELKFRQMYENTSIGIGIISLDYKFIGANQAFCKMLGYTEKEFVGKTLNDITHSDIINRNLELQEQLKLGLIPSFQLEKAFIHKDGHTVYGLINSTLIKNTNGESLYFLGNVQDITAIKKAEKELIIAKEKSEENEAKFRSLFENSPTGISQTGLDGTMLVNQSFCDMLGYTKEELQQMNWKTITFPEDIVKSDEVMQALIEGKITKGRFEKRYIHKNQTIIWTDISIFLQRDGNNNPLYFITAVTDISAIKKAEEELKNTHEQLNATLNALPDLLFEIDYKTIIYDYRAPDESLLYAPPSEFLGKPVKAILPEEALQKLMFALEEATKNGKCTGVKYALNFPDGIRWFDLSVSTKRFSGELRFILLIRDITANKQAEADLKESEEKFRKIFENHSAVKLLVDAETGAIVDANKAAIKFYGWSLDELKQMNIFSINTLPSQTGKERMNKVNAIHHARTEFKHRLKNGEVIDVEVYISKIYIGGKAYHHAIVHDITERRKAEQEVQKQNNRLESLLKIAQYPAESTQELLDFALDEAMKLTGSKIGYIYFYNSQNKQFTLNTWSKDVMKECRVLNPQTVYDLGKTGCWGEAVRQRKPIVINDYTAENAFKRGTPEGHVKLVKFLTIPVFSDGDIVAVAGVANKDADYDNSDIRHLTLLMDSVWRISERLRLIKDLQISKEKAEESGRRYKSLFSNMMNAFGLHEMKFNKNGEAVDYEFLEVNPVWEKVVGLKADEVIGKRIKEIMPNIEQSWLDRYGRIVLTGIPEEFTDYNAATQKYYNVFAYKLEGNKFAVVFNDVTDKKNFESELIRAKEKAEESEQRLRLAALSGKLGIWDWNVKENILKWDDRMFEMYGIKKDNFQNNVDAWTNALHPEDKERVINETNSALNIDKHFNIIFRVVHPDGKILHIKAEGVVIKDIENKPVRMIGINMDITPDILAEQELIKAKEKAEESDRLKSAFLSNMSHEIRTPMNGILGFMDLLEQPELSEKEKAGFIKIINKSGERLLNTINDIVEISRIEVGDIKLNLEVFDLTELMQYYCDFFGPQAGEKGLNIEITQQIRGEIAMIKTDKHKLDGILMNLIKNAIKFTDQGKIEIGNYLKNGKLWFFVTDTGRGIPEDKKDIIFNRFVQADVELTRGYEGAGIGLSIVKAYVEALGGEIQLQSQLGRGSTFLFSIPYKHSVKKTFEESTEKTEKETSAMKKTLLVVEDDKVSYYFLEKILEPDYQLLHARNGEEAISLFKNHREISMVLMDIKIPGKYDGLEVTRKIRQINRHVPVIAQTAYAMKPDIKKAMDAGCNDYITKPINRNKLRDLISNYL